MRHPFALSSFALSALLLTMSCTNSSSTNTDQAAAGSTTEQQATAPSTAPHATPPASTPIPQSATEAASSIPDFTFYKVKSGISYTKADIPENKNTVFLLFDPGCNHCQQETAALAKNYEKIKDVNILYVSMNDPALMTQFFSTFGKELEGKANVEMLWDRNQDFIQRFHIPDMFPANYVYGPDGQLKAYWEGEKSIDEIIAAFTK